MDATAEVARRLRAGGGVLLRGDHPDLTTAFDWLIREGKLVAVLPGVYSLPEWRQQPIVGMRAGLLRHPDSVLVGGAAARASYWPTAPLDRIELAVRRKVTSQPGFAFRQRVIRPELIVEHQGLRMTSPALTAIDLADERCADSIDIALRTRSATVGDMHAALAATPRRAGNHVRLKLLIDSRDEPWSAAERLAHRLLRAAKITGWQANLPTMIQDQLYYLDVGFRSQKLVLEIDGRIHQTDRHLFESDRWRQNALVLAGWRVLRFTWRMVEDHPDQFVRQVRRAL